MTKHDRSPFDGPPWLRLDIFFDPDGDAISAPLIRLSGQAREAKAALPGQAELVGLACKIYRSRRRRADFLSVSLLGEPVWDMLLALYCFSARGEVLSVSALCQSAGVPQTTALRWVQLMEQKGLIHRCPDANDGRRAFLSLDDEVKCRMNSYLAGILSELGT